MSSDLEFDGDLPEGLEDDDASAPYLAVVEVCILTPEGEIATGGCTTVECSFDHSPNYEEIGLCALDESQDWLSTFQAFDSFNRRFGNNPTVVIGNIIVQREY